MSSAICFNLDQSKILSSGNGLSEAFPVKTMLKVYGKACANLIDLYQPAQSAQDDKKRPFKLLVKNHRTL